MFYKWRPVRARPAALRGELKRRPKVIRRAGRGEGGLSPVTDSGGPVPVCPLLPRGGVSGCGCLVSKAWHTEKCQCYCELGRFRSVFSSVSTTCWPPIIINLLFMADADNTDNTDCFIKCSINFNVQQNETVRSKRWLNIVTLTAPTQPCEGKRHQSLWK